MSLSLAVCSPVRLCCSHSWRLFWSPSLTCLSIDFFATTPPSVLPMTGDSPQFFPLALTSDVTGNSGLQLLSAVVFLFVAIFCVQRSRVAYSLILWLSIWLHPHSLPEQLHVPPCVRSVSLQFFNLKLLTSFAGMIFTLTGLPARIAGLCGGTSISLYSFCVSEACFLFSLVVAVPSPSVNFDFPICVLLPHWLFCGLLSLPPSVWATPRRCLVLAHSAALLCVLGMNASPSVVTLTIFFCGMAVALTLIDPATSMLHNHFLQEQPSRHRHAMVSFPLNFCMFHSVSLCMSLSLRLKPALVPAVSFHGSGLIEHCMLPAWPWRCMEPSQQSRLHPLFVLFLFCTFLFHLREKNVWGVTAVQSVGFFVCCVTHTFPTESTISCPCVPSCSIAYCPDADSCWTIHGLDQCPPGCAQGLW